jgi:hypothetical protein
VASQVFNEILSFKKQLRDQVLSVKVYDMVVTHHNTASATSNLYPTLSLFLTLPRTLAPCPSILLESEYGKAGKKRYGTIR